MTIPPIVTDMPPVEATRGKMPTTVIVICILQGIYLIIDLITVATLYVESAKFKNEILNKKNSFDIQMGQDSQQITNKMIDQSIALTDGGLLFSLILISISALLLIGLIKGNRLTWYFHRTIGLLIAILSILNLAWLPMRFDAAIASGDLKTYLSLFITVIHILITWYYYFGIGTESARDFFSAICPRCRSKKIMPINFLATKVRCKSCGTEWT